MCGEHLRADFGELDVEGSSPRVRGTLLGTAPYAGRPGIIPACAGNTRLIDGGGDEGGDHPRVCGEHGTADITGAGISGSSPRVRGTRIQRADHSRDAGIIPACAGNTHEVLSNSRKTRDHPRVCGEHLVFGCVAVMRRGSSPRVRGTRDHVGNFGAGLGIIPACAGNTSILEHAAGSRRDHPRVCGEHCVGRCPRSS